MKTDKRIKAYNKKYVKELDNALFEIKPYLIDAFTNFYGKEYYLQIKSTIESIKFTYFLSETFFHVIEHKSFGVRHKDYQIAKYYINYLKNIGLKLKGINDLDKLELEVFRTFIAKTYLDEELLRTANFIELLESDAPVYSIVSDMEEQNFYKSIFLPIFVIDLEIIIHEINHALMIDVVAKTFDELVMPSLFSNVLCDELFNDYIAHLVLEEFIKLKPRIPYVLRRFEFVNSHENYFYLIEVFYYVFEQVIKESIMTKNFNLLYEYAGKEDFLLFCSLVEKYSLQNECSSEEFNFLLEIIFRMNNHALEVTHINYEEYFKELESRGIRVRRLK